MDGVVSDKKVFTCYHCSKSFEFSEKLSFREECSHCSADLHICLNCRFYEESAYNQCKESSAEPVRDKERRNICEYFEASQGGSKFSDKKEQLKLAESLFKKK